MTSMQIRETGNVLSARRLIHKRSQRESPLLLFHLCPAAAGRLSRSAAFTDLILFNREHRTTDIIILIKRKGEKKTELDVAISLREGND